MKTAPLPETINPSRLAISQVEITGDIKVSELDRLLGLLASDAGVLRCNVRCDKDEQQRLMISGDISASLMMSCQLCLQPMEVELEQHFNLMVVDNDAQAGEILENHEPIEVDNDRVQVKKLFEDEAILGIPVAPSHNPEFNCLQHKSFAGEVSSVTPLETKQPFADLKSLMEQSSDTKD